jgi:hypothetical protein
MAKKRAARKTAVARHDAYVEAREVDMDDEDVEMTGETIRPKQLAWKHRKSGETGVFVALYEEILHDVPATVSAPPTARIALFNEITRALRAQPADVVNTGGIPFAIPWTMLDFPADGIGREKRVDKGHIGYIVQHYHAPSMTPPLVNMRPIYENGRLVTVRFEVPDGWHRTRIQMELAYADRPDDLRTGKNPIKIQVQVAPVASMAEVATSFSKNNDDGKRPMAGSDSWRNMYIAGDEEVVKAVELAAEYGLDASAPPNKRGWPRFANGKIIMHMCDGARYHFPWITEKDVRRALQLITDPACEGLYKHKEALKQNFFGGLCHLIAYYERPGYMHDIGLKHMFSRPDVLSRIEELAKEMSPALLTVEMQIPEASISRDESKRYHNYAAAMRRLYLASVPQPKARSSNWADCPPELRQLFHVAPSIQDENERKRFIAEMNAALAKRLGPKQRLKSVKAAGNAKSITR